VENFADATLARFYLCIGGVFGLHRLYCGQMFESLVYLSTFGLFLLGPLFDVFRLNGIVQAFNDRQIKANLKDDDEKDSYVFLI
jgi:TM2 domain-containing membrane protein YozV